MSQWITVCPIADILPGTGVCALIGDRQVAVFRSLCRRTGVRHQQYRPVRQASVLSRGLIAEHQGELWVASPLKKQHFRLYDGHCLEDDSRSVASFASRVVDGIVHVAA